MEIKEILMSITDEVKACMEKLDERQLQELETQIQKANKIFVAGAGRSLMMIRGLAMRLMQTGFTSYVVGETITPAIEPGDLLIVASGSGSTATLVSIANKCKSIGATLALITIHPNSKIGQLADYVVEIQAKTLKDGGNNVKSVQPGGNTFEQCVLMLGDAIITDIVSNMSLDEYNTNLMKKHANLE